MTIFCTSACDNLFFPKIRHALDGKTCAVTLQRCPYVSCTLAYSLCPTFVLVGSQGPKTAHDNARNHDFFRMKSGMPFEKKAFSFRKQCRKKNGKCFASKAEKKTNQIRYAFRKKSISFPEAMS